MNRYEQCAAVQLYDFLPRSLGTRLNFERRVGRALGGNARALRGLPGVYFLCELGNRSMCDQGS